VPHPVKTLTDKISLTNPAARRVPGVFILTVDPGHAAADDDFYLFAERAAHRGWPVLQMAADHNPYWFQPEATAELIDHACRLPATETRTQIPLSPLSKNFRSSYTEAPDAPRKISEAGPSRSLGRDIGSSVSSR
jgi:hypothetical protein